MNNTTIAAISTAQGEGGIGVIRISGDNAFKIADAVFKSAGNKKISEMKGYTASFGKIYDKEEEIDETVALVFTQPHSYTGENVVELSCHGGIFVTKQVLRAVLNAGALPAQAGEFTKRAFLNGKMDLTEAESVIDIINAKSKSAAKAALCVKDGALRRKIDSVKEQLLSAAAHLCAWADYPDEDVEDVTVESLLETCTAVSSRLDALLQSYDGGQAVKTGIDTVIAGRPNVGKSTLMNLLSGCEKSIVTDIPGTTRDVVEDTVIAGNVILRLSDTAGLRSTADTVEKIGVDRAKKRLEQCALLLAVFDNSTELDKNDVELINACANTEAIAIINKTDLKQKLDIDYIKSKIKRTVFISAKSGEGAKQLVDAIEQAAGAADFNPSEGILSNERQRLAVSNALLSVNEAKTALASGVTFDAITVLIEEAVSQLLELTGEKASDEIIDRVFHNFCVGK